MSYVRVLPFRQQCPGWALDGGEILSVTSLFRRDLADLCEDDPLASTFCLINFMAISSADLFLFREVELLLFC